MIAWLQLFIGPREVRRFRRIERDCRWNGTHPDLKWLEINGVMVGQCPLCRVVVAVVAQRPRWGLRPTSTSGTPGIAGREYYATDTGQRFRDTGTGWYEIQGAGDLKPTARATAPDGWLLCDGSSKLRSDFPALFAALGEDRPRTVFRTATTSTCLICEAASQSESTVPPAGSTRSTRSTLSETRPAWL